jgi:DNA-binding NarL/FixJ family response regulator
MLSVRIAILSDDRLLGEGLLRIIGGEPSFVVVGEGDRPAFGPALRAAGPQVLLVDSRMEGALALCADLRGQGGPAVIFMAAQDDDGWAMSALEAGARGILAKSAGAEDLVKAVHVVSEGQVWARRHVLAGWLEHLATGSGAVRVGEPNLKRLSDREREVFRHAATGLSNKELAKRLAISHATVKAHLTSIFQKLGLRGRGELAAAYHGMIPPAPQHPSPSGSPLRPKGNA